eukprot:GEMP01029846.1.p1 GENE.GEMP01029846.1~~GEMP01029846.1.p1  ORF type:complete len:313 (+),score=67.06 GEMP01029846.1:80-1018(+)
MVTTRQMVACTPAKVDIAEYEKQRADGRVGYDGRDFEYCPYTETSKQYDVTRQPFAIQLYYGALTMSNTPLNEQKLLDVGCGTGSFLATLQVKLGSVEGIEYNDGMIEQSRGRLGPSVKLVQGSADALPHPDETFDVVTINQVIHHLPPENDYAFLKRFIVHAYRVLKPGGVFIINTSSSEQVLRGFWWSALMPKAMEQVLPRFPPIATIKEFLVEVGFQLDQDSLLVPVEATLMAPEKYGELGLEGAFDKSYRDGDSFWSVGEQTNELPTLQATIREMQKNGTDKQWWENAEETRRRVGQATFIISRKPQK